MFDIGRMGCGSSSPSEDPAANAAGKTETSGTAPAAGAMAAPAAKTDSKIGAMLKDVPLLQHFSEDKLNLLGGAMVLQKYKDGEPVFEEGDLGTHFYVITAGEANVMVKENDKLREIGHLAVGDYFGETALQNEAPRGASILAHKSLEVNKKQQCQSCLTYFHRHSFRVVHPPPPHHPHCVIRTTTTGMAA